MGGRGGRGRRGREIGGRGGARKGGPEGEKGGREGKRKGREGLFARARSKGGGTYVVGCGHDLTPKLQTSLPQINTVCIARCALVMLCSFAHSEDVRLCRHDG